MGQPSGLPRVRRAGKRAGPALGHDDPHRPAGGHPVLPLRATSALLLLRPRLPGRPSPAGPAARAAPGRRGADRGTGPARDGRGPDRPVRRPGCGWPRELPSRVGGCLALSRSAGDLRASPKRPASWHPLGARGGRFRRGGAAGAQCSAYPTPTPSCCSEVPRHRGGPEVLAGLEGPLEEAIAGMRAVHALLPDRVAARVRSSTSG